MSGSLKQAFGVQTEVTATDLPKGTSLEAQEFSPAVPEPTDAERGAATHRGLRSEHARSRSRACGCASSRRRRKPPTGRQQQLRAMFRQEIDDGRLLIRQDGSNVVIQLLEKDSFPSGSAASRAELRSNALAKVGAPRRRHDGRDHGVGPHRQRSDPQRRSVPLELGAVGRARRVRRARAARGGTRSGATDGERPRRHATASRRTTRAANRALNRRVDITFANGRDRHGQWSDALPAESTQ